MTRHLKFLSVPVQKQQLPRDPSLRKGTTRQGLALLLA